MLVTRKTFELKEGDVIVTEAGQPKVVINVKTFADFSNVDLVPVDSQMCWSGEPETYTLYASSEWQIQEDDSLQSGDKNKSP